MPYPFGVFTTAQALVSATPDSPAAVRITEVREGNQTIADDFLYLLIKDIKCPDTETRKDCDCDAPKKASRLPDQADLIESNEYSQDIGGSCVNLSTPNRTLSEFNYQAIVRTSDPEVANYVLKRVDVAQVDIGPVLLSQILQAASALNSARNPSFVLSFNAVDILAAVAKVEAIGNLAANVSYAELTAALNNVEAILYRFSGFGIPNAGNDNALVASAGVVGAMPPPVELHVCLRKHDGRFFHAFRKADGSWDGFNDASGIQNSGSNNTLVACAGVGNELHVCLHKTDGRFFHAFRRADGSWDGFNDASSIPNSGSDNTLLACAGVGNDLHMCLLKTDGRFFHAFRRADGTWDGFNDASGIPNSGSDNFMVACAGSANELYVGLRKHDGRFFYAIRRADRSWYGFYDGSGVPNADVISGSQNETQRSVFETTREFAQQLKALLKTALVPRMETRYELIGNTGIKQFRFKTNERMPIGLNNPVRWQDDGQNMSLYQAVSIATGHILHYKAEFKADGYSLGDLHKELR